MYSIEELADDFRYLLTSIARMTATQCRGRQRPCPRRAVVAFAQLRSPAQCSAVCRRAGFLHGSAGSSNRTEGYQLGTLRAFTGAFRSRQSGRSCSSMVRVRGVLTSPVCLVVTVSIRMIQHSSSAIGLCRVPRGMIQNSPDEITTSDCP